MIPRTQDVAPRATSKKASLFILGTQIAALNLVLPHAHAWRDVKGVCRGALLPKTQIRHLRNLRLECTSSVDQFSRTFVPFEDEEWKDKQELSLGVDAEYRSELRRDMQALRQKADPIISNSGVIQYETVEVWEWTELVYGPHPSCGYRNETKCVPSYIPGQPDVCTEEMVMQTCEHDEDRISERFCSNETLKYRAEFIRPSIEEWNPDTPGYLDVLPNKYDLMPGEREDISVYSNYMRSRTLTPLLTVKRPRNDYSTAIRFKGSTLSSRPCAVDSPQDLEIKIYTSHRLTSTQSPNAFVQAQDSDKRRIDPIRWLTSVNDAGMVVRSRPDSIVLSDQGADLVEIFSKETRNTSLHKGWKSFYKNTIVRLRLVQRGFNLWRPRKIYVNASHMTLDEYGNYVLPLNVQGNTLFQRKSGYFGALKNWFKVALQRGKSYTLYVSVYQKDMPFYAQACDETSSYFCRLFNWENNYYSEEIPIDFQTDSQLDYKALMDKITEIVDHS